MSESVLELAKRIRDGQFLPTTCSQHTRHQSGCAACQSLAANRRKAHLKAATYGWTRPEKLLAADNARTHINHLHDTHHISYRRIANLAGLANATVQRIGAGVQHAATQATIDAILAVQPDNLPRTHRGTVVAVGAARRLQALMWLGYRAEDLAPELNTDPETVRRWRRCYFPSLTPQRHEQIAALADRLDGTRGPSSLAHQRAVANGWVPLAAWDDIDDPTASPAPGSLHTPTGERRLSHGLVKAALHGFVPLAALTDTERQQVWVRWNAGQATSGHPAGAKPFARAYSITEWQARQIARAAAALEADPTPAAACRTNRKVA